LSQHSQVELDRVALRLNQRLERPWALRLQPIDFARVLRRSVEPADIIGKVPSHVAVGIIRTFARLGGSAASSVRRFGTVGRGWRPRTKPMRGARARWATDPASWFEKLQGTDTNGNPNSRNPSCRTHREVGAIHPDDWASHRTASTKTSDSYRARATAPRSRTIQGRSRSSIQFVVLAQLADLRSVSIQGQRLARSKAG